MAEPVDLLDGAGRASRGKAARDALKQRTRPEDAFPTSRDGRLIVREERDGKRRRDDSEDDSDGGSDGGRTARTARTARTSNTRRTSRTELSRGDKFRSKKAQGDAKKGALEPFAYWPMDRKMLNRRKAKQKVAQKELGKVVRSAKRQRQG